MPLFLFLLLSLGSPIFAMEVVGENGGQAACTAFVAHRELKVFRDPKFFLPYLRWILADPKIGWEKLTKESPLRSTLLGPVSLKILGEPREFKNFGVVARFYELAEPRLKIAEGEWSQGASEKIVPVQICGDDGGLGFVLKSDLEKSRTQEEKAGEGMPPSILPNPVPVFREKISG
jgi:hypothetical protein